MIPEDQSHMLGKILLRPPREEVGKCIDRPHRSFGLFLHQFHLSVLNDKSLEIVFIHFTAVPVTRSPGLHDKTHSVAFTAGKHFFQIVCGAAAL